MIRAVHCRIGSQEGAKIRIIVSGVQIIQPAFSILHSTAKPSFDFSVSTLFPCLSIWVIQALFFYFSNIIGKHNCAAYIVGNVVKGLLFFFLPALGHNYINSIGDMSVGTIILHFKETIYINCFGFYCIIASSAELFDCTLPLIIILKFGLKLFFTFSKDSNYSVWTYRYMGTNGERTNGDWKGVLDSIK